VDASTYAITLEWIYARNESHATDAVVRLAVARRGEQQRIKAGNNARNDCDENNDTEEDYT
jgi:hypothetical protein